MTLGSVFGILIGLPFLTRKAHQLVSQRVIEYLFTPSMRRFFVTALVGVLGYLFELTVIFSFAAALIGILIGMGVVKEWIVRRRQQDSA